MHVYLGADHRGFAAKEQVVTILKGRQISYTDFGAYEYNAEDDYNDFAKKVCQAIIDSNSPDSFGVLLCGSAQGMAMQANRFKGIRISTRPDAIDDDVLTLLKSYNTTAVELGAQSMDEQVQSKVG